MLARVLFVLGVSTGLEIRMHATSAASTAIVESAFRSKPMLVGWYRELEVFAECMPPETMDWSAMTHVTYSSLCPYVAGEYNCSGAFNTSLLTRVVTAAHAHDVKVLLMVSWNSDLQVKPWDTEQLSEKFVASVANAVQYWGFDGVEYDVEDFPKPNITLRNLYTRNILIPTRAALHKVVPASRVTVGVCLAAYNYNPWVFVENSRSLYAAVDFFNVMSYNWQAVDTSESHPFPTASVKALTTLAAYGIPKEKLNMGIGWYTHPGGGSAVCSLAKNPTCATALKSAPAKNICAGEQYDGPQMGYEMGRFAAAQGWGGVMTFCVNYDSHNTLLTPLAQGLRNGTLERSGDVPSPLVVAGTY